MFLTSFTPNDILMITGFLLSLFACVSNDCIQTMGTFLINTKHRPLWQIWLYVCFVICLTFIIGRFVNNGDMAFGRLDRVPYPDKFYWWHILPPIVLICLTKCGIPCATSFLIVSTFSSSTVIGMMVAKSAFGYTVALIVGFIVYMLISRKIEKYFLYTKNKPYSKKWIIAKWISTAFLLCAWLLQDGAVLYVYMPRKMEFFPMIISLLAFCTLLYIVCYGRGGNLAGIIKLKTNTQDIRSATIIDIIYGLILVYFMFVNNIPMSTTWVFIGLLAGREIAMYNRLRFETQKKVYKHVLKDLLKTITGLIVSILVVFSIHNFNSIKEILHAYFNL